VNSNGAVSIDYNELILMEDNEAVSTQWAATKPTEKNYNDAVPTDEDYEALASEQITESYGESLTT